MSDVTEMWWRTRGFSEFPSFRHAKIGERFYRVLGGPTSQLYGSFYTLTHPKSVSQAEFDLNINCGGSVVRRPLRVSTQASPRCSVGVPVYQK